ncbi:MAG: hypothetical protein KBT03_04805 [Bacteroidales bacterium]|nr:hypothetical protein [Candidatus Scybalousia scybalohippi]
MLNVPCLKCDRAGCGKYHDICPDYQRFRNEKAAENKAKKVEYEKVSHYKFGQFKNFKPKFKKCHKK